MQHVQRIGGIVGQVLVEGVIVFRLDAAFGFAPQGGLGIDALAVHQHGEGHEGRMLADDGLHPVGFQKFRRVLLEVCHDDGPPRRFGVRAFLHGKGAETVAAPAPGGGIAVGKGGTRRHLDLFGHHEHGIEAHPEPADDIGGVGGFAFLAFLRGQTGEELFGAGFGDGAEVVRQFLGRHAHAGIGDGQGPGVLVQGDTNFQRRVRQAGRFAAIGPIAQFVQRVRGVGNEFAQKNLPVGVQRVCQDIQNLSHLGAKFALFASRHGKKSSSHKYLL